MMKLVRRGVSVCKGSYMYLPTCTIYLDERRILFVFSAPKVRCGVREANVFDSSVSQNCRVWNSRITTYLPLKQGSERCAGERR
jgi:hypothetical protein